MNGHRFIYSPALDGGWYGACSCGGWSLGPRDNREIVNAYWLDHYNLTTTGHVIARREPTS